MCHYLVIFLLTLLNSLICLENKKLMDHRHHYHWEEFCPNLVLFLLLFNLLFSFDFLESVLYLVLAHFFKISLFLNIFIKLKMI